MLRSIVFGILLSLGMACTFAQKVDSLQNWTWEPGFNELKELGKQDQAIDWLDDALISYEIDTTSREYRDWLSYRGNIYDMKGDYLNALPLFQKALVLTDTQEIKIAGILMNLGRMNGFLGDYDVARKFYRESLRYSLKFYGPDDLNVALAYNNIGVNMEAIGDFSQALTYYHRALNIRRKLLGNDHELIGDALHNIANSHYYLNQLDEAESYCLQGLEIRRKVLGDNHIKIAYSYTTLGIVEAIRENYPKALTYFQKELAIKQSIHGSEHMDLVYSFNNLGVLYIRMEKYEKALKAHTKALKIIEKNVGEKHPFLAQTYDNISQDFRNLSDYPKAIDYVQQALIKVHRTFNNENPQSNPSPEGSLNEREMLRMLSNKSQIYLEYALLRNKDEELLEKGLNAFRKAADLMDHTQRSYKAEESLLFLQESSLTVYERGLEILWLLYQKTKDISYLEEAFICSEKSKSTLLLGAIQDSRAKEFAGIPSSFLEKETAIKQELLTLDGKLKAEQDSQRLATLNNQYAILKISYDSLVQQMETQYPSYYQLKYAIPEISLQKAQKEWIAEDQELLMYYDSDTVIHAFYLNATDAIWKKLPLDFPLEETVNEFHNSIHGYFTLEKKNDQAFQKNDSLFKELGFFLYQKMVDPIFSDGISVPLRLLIIPTGIMGYIPFEALLTASPDSISPFNQLPYFLHQTHVQYAYSGRVHLEMRNRKIPSGQKGVLGIAPTFFASLESDDASRTALGPLISNENEVKKVNGLAGGKMLMGTDATREAFLAMAGTYSILHLATHGKLNDNNPNQSFLAFAQPNDTNQSQFLYLNELYNLHLPTEMVVLSACETGIGKLLRGEGMASLSRGFSYTGAKSILTTLWSINDSKSAELMESYYQYLAKGLKKDVALGNAKRDFLTKNDNYFSHPFFWASYIPLGEMDPISFSSSFPWIWVIAFLVILSGFFVLRIRTKSRTKRVSAW